MVIKKLKTKKGGDNIQVIIDIFNIKKELTVDSNKYNKPNILIHDDSIDYLLLLYNNKQLFSGKQTQINYIININIFKNLIADKFTLEITDIDKSNDKLIFSYIINSIIYNIDYYILKRTVQIRDNDGILNSLKYFKNIKYNIKKILDIINNYIKLENDNKINIETYDINNLIIEYFNNKEYNNSLPSSSKNFNEILLEIFKNYILNLSDDIFLNFGNLIKFKIKSILNISNINKVIYLNNDKIIFDLFSFLVLYKIINTTINDDNINEFITDIDTLKKKLTPQNIIEITDIVINKYNKKININFLSSYILLFKDDEINKVNATDKIIKELESLIINSEIINKLDNYIDNYYTKDFGQQTLFNTVEEVYTNVPNDIYKENIKILFQNIAYKEVVRFSITKYRINTKATFINVIISELEKQQIYYTEAEIEDFIKLDSENIIIIKNTINNIILCLLLDIIFKTFYSNNIKSDIYDNIIYLYIYIDIYKNLVFTDDTYVIDLKKTLGKYLYNKYYNNYNYIVLYSHNYENDIYNVIYIYKEDIVLLEDKNNNIIDIDSTYNKYFEDFKKRLNKLLSSRYYIENTLSDKEKSKISLNAVIISPTISSIGQAGGAGESFLNMFSKDKKKDVESESELLNKKKEEEKIVNLIDKTTKINSDETDKIKELEENLDNSKSSLETELTEINKKISEPININTLAIKKTSESSDVSDISDELIGLENAYEVYKTHFDNYTRKITETRFKIDKLKQTQKESKPTYEEIIKTKISILFQEIEKISESNIIEELKIKLKEYFSDDKYKEQLKLIEYCTSISELKNLLDNEEFNNEDIKNVYHLALYNFYKNYRNDENTKILKQINDYKEKKNKLNEENKKLNEIKQIIVYDNTNIINIFLSVINLVKNRLRLIHDIDIIDNDIGNQINIIYRQNDNWIINLSNIIINANRRIKSGIADSKDYGYKIKKVFDYAYEKVFGKKPKRQASYIIQAETNDDENQIYLTFGPPLLLRTQYIKKAGDSKHNYTIEKSSINKKGGRIIENNYNKAAYKIAVKLFKLTDNNKISFVFRETTKNSDKNIYKYKAELKINKKTNKKEIKLKEISDKKKI